MTLCVMESTVYHFSFTKNIFEICDEIGKTDELVKRILQ